MNGKWRQDPTGRFKARWHDGTGFTAFVSNEPNGTVWQDASGLGELGAGQISARPVSPPPSVGGGGTEGNPWQGRSARPSLQQNWVAGAVEFFGALTIAGAVFVVMAALAMGGDSSTDPTVAFLVGLAIGIQGLLLFAFGRLVRSSQESVDIQRHTAKLQQEAVDLLRQAVSDSR